MNFIKSALFVLIAFFIVGTEVANGGFWDLFDTSCKGKDCQNESDEISSSSSSSDEVETESIVFELLGDSGRKSSVSIAKDTKLELLCKGFGNAEVEWYSPGSYIPKTTKVQGKRLIFPKVDCSDAGTYVCVPKVNENKQYVAVELEVVSDDCKETTTSEVRSSTRTQLITTTKATSPYSDENDATGLFSNIISKFLENTSSTFYVPDWETTPDPFPVTAIGYPNFTAKTTDGEICCYRCNRDSVPPKIVSLPERRVDIDCVGPNRPALNSRVLELECRFEGNPTPVVTWKKNSGLVPSKCEQRSRDGHGILTCPNFEKSDQGAYSCVAENVHGRAESQPKSVVRCNQVTCSDGFEVADEDGIVTCLDCFCSGKTDQCTGIRSSLIQLEIEFPTKRKQLLMDTFADADEMWASSSGHQGDVVEYCSVPESTLHSISFLKSYGRNLIVPRINRDRKHSKGYPDIIIQGNDLKMTYSFGEIPGNSPTLNVRLLRGDWLLTNMTVATRADVMTVLSRVQMLLIRCRYGDEIPRIDPTWKIILESSKVSDDWTGVSYIEKCTCPKGYDGLSCEVCAPGYERKPGKDFICQPKSVTQGSLVSCPVGGIGENCDCDVDRGYYRRRNECVKSKCQLKGSIGIFPDEDDQCICKEAVTGQYCTICKPGYFNLEELNPEGCKKCWCSGRSNQCQSLNWYREEISSSSWGGYDIDGKSYWLLSSAFTGNWLRSYGGYLRYTMKFSRNLVKQPRPLTVEILGKNRVSIIYTHHGTNEELAEEEKSWEVPIEEPHWRYTNNETLTREMLLDLLTSVTAVFIESPYSIEFGMVNVTRVTLDTAVDMSNNVNENDDRVTAVELCTCPDGYEGLSCETCAEGYYKKRTGNSTFVCELCQCEFCHPEYGCVECRKGEYRENSGYPPECKPCPCNGNEERCLKDVFDQVVCTCKAGYHGLKCEYEDRKVPSYLTITIMPRIVRHKKVGTLVTFNCTYDSQEEMRIEFHKKYSRNPDIPGILDARNSKTFKLENFGTTTSFEIGIEEDLVSVMCVVFDSTGSEAGRIFTNIVDSVTEFVKPEITSCYDEPRTVFEGDDLELICDTTGDPEPVVRWHKVEDGRMVEVASVGGVHVTSPATASLNGTLFVCTARNVAGEDKCNARVIVSQRCETITAYPKRLVVNETSTAHFDCGTTTAGLVTWSKKVGPMSRGVRIENGRLTIENVQLFDEGEYECTAETSDGALRASVWLEVMILGEPPEALIPEEDVVLAEGKNLVINCVVRGRPKPKVVWTRIGHPHLPTNFHVTNDALGLVVTSAQVDNSGIYQCRAESSLGNSTSRIKVEVVQIPEIKVDPEVVTVGEGVNLNLRCHVLRGTPPLEFKWSKLDQSGARDVDLSLSPSLSLNKVSVGDSGTYRCTVSNAGGKAFSVSRVTVGSPAVVTLEPSGSVNVHVGQKVTLRCQATGVPPPHISWLRTSAFDRDEVSEPIGETGETLTIDVDSKLRRITCKGSNEIGSDKKSTLFHLLTVMGEESTTSDPSLVKRAPLGSQVELIFPGLDGEFKCHRQNSTGLHDECYIHNGLLIKSVQVQHSTTYTCKTVKGKEVSYQLEVVGFVNRFSHRGRSFMQLSGDNTSPNEFHVEMTFKTDRKSGLLLLKKRHHGFALFLSRGKLRARVRRNPSQVIKLELEHSIRPGVWYTAVCHVQQRVELFLYDESGMIVETAFHPLNFIMDWTGKDIFFLGGTGILERGYLALLERDGYYFEGCISRLMINHHVYDITQEANYSKNVSLCQVCARTNPCGSEGVCYDAPTEFGYVCLCEREKTCPENCRGLACRNNRNLCKLLNPCGSVENVCTVSNNSLHCRCAEGFTGSSCEREERYKFGFTGDGYVQLPSHYLPRHNINDPEFISVEFAGEGTILFQGDEFNYLSISYENDVLLYKYHNQGQELFIKGDNPPHRGESRKLVIQRRKNLADLYLDGAHYREQTEFRTNRVRGDIFIGGVPKGNQVKNGFRGCILGVSFDSRNKLINVMETDMTRLNVLKHCK